MKKIILFIFLGFQFNVIGQTLDSIQRLDEMFINADRLLSNFSKTQKTQILLDGVLNRSQASLTNLLNFNSAIYFKENGLGMVSSPSFRGTTAQQTAVIWNGININSQLNGQTDFNTINIRNFDAVTIRSGGGSVLYGSGAIGGSIHLNNAVDFNTNFTNDFVLKYGSFNTKDLSYKGMYANDRFSVHLGIAHNSSDNDYSFVESDRNNLNGAFSNASVSVNLGYKVNSQNTLRFYSQVFNSDRNLSLVLPSDSRTKYKDFNTRNLLEWELKYDKLISVLRTAQITEKYTYFENIERSTFSFGEAKSYIGNHQLNYNFSKNSKITSVLDINHTVGTGTNIAKNVRTVGALSLLFQQNFKKLTYETSLRKEITSTFKSPLLFSAGAKYQFFDAYALRVNASKNFRIPTFNDLYWAGSGNKNLQPEVSHQIELGNQFQLHNNTLEISGFYYDITDMIRWLPNENNIWQPINTDHVISYGLEAQLNIIKKWNSHTLKVNANYSYTVSENANTEKQLIYVPFHKIYSNISSQFKNINFYWQHLFVGDVFIQSDNNPNKIVSNYWIQNIGLDYNFKKNISSGFTIQNIFNVNYQNVADRFMPGINYNFYINFNI